MAMPAPYIYRAPMGADVRGSWRPALGALFWSATLKWTKGAGTGPTGTFIIEATNDPTLAVDDTPIGAAGLAQFTLTAAAAAVAGAASEQGEDYLGYRFCRLVYKRTSGDPLNFLTGYLVLK